MTVGAGSIFCCGTKISTPIMLDSYFFEKFLESSAENSAKIAAERFAQNIPQNSSDRIYIRQWKIKIMMMLLDLWIFFCMFKIYQNTTRRKQKQKQAEAEETEEVKKIILAQDQQCMKNEICHACEMKITKFASTNKQT